MLESPAMDVILIAPALGVELESSSTPPSSKFLKDLKEKFEYSRPFCLKRGRELFLTCRASLKPRLEEWIRDVIPNLTIVAHEDIPRNTAVNPVEILRVIEPD